MKGKRYLSARTKLTLLIEFKLDKFKTINKLTVILKNICTNNSFIDNFSK